MAEEGSSEEWGSSEYVGGVRKRVTKGRVQGKEAVRASTSVRRLLDS